MVFAVTQCHTLAIVISMPKLSGLLTSQFFFTYIILPPAKKSFVLYHAWLVEPVLLNLQTGLSITIRWWSAFALGNSSDLQCTNLATRILITDRSILRRPRIELAITIIYQSSAFVR